MIRLCIFLCYASTATNGFVPTGLHGDGKCSHGGVIDLTSLRHATGGINKDSTSEVISPHNYLHVEAARVATAATVVLLNSLWDRVGDDLFTRFMRLDYGATISFVFDTTSTLRDDMIEAYRQMSASFANSPSLRPSDFFFVPFNDQGNDLRMTKSPIFSYCRADRFWRTLSNSHSS